MTTSPTEQRPQDLHLGELVKQLSSSAPAPTPDELAEIVASPATHLLVALDSDGAVLGMLTLAVFRIPTGVRAWIEDVVVDEAARGAAPARRFPATRWRWRARPARAR